MDIFIEMISYPFMVRAIIVGCLVSLCASLLGTSLVLKRYSMIGDGLSHVGFAALAIAYAFHAEPLTISIPACIAAAFFLLQLKDSAKIKGDSATALLCSGALAIGVMTISLSKRINLGNNIVHSICLGIHFPHGILESECICSHSMHLIRMPHSRAIITFCGITFSYG